MPRRSKTMRMSDMDEVLPAAGPPLSDQPPGHRLGANRLLPHQRLHPRLCPHGGRRPPRCLRRQLLLGLSRSAKASFIPRIEPPKVVFHGEKELVAYDGGHVAATNWFVPRLIAWLDKVLGRSI